MHVQRQTRAAPLNFVSRLDQNLRTDLGGDILELYFRGDRASQQHLGRRDYGRCLGGSLVLAPLLRAGRGDWGNMILFYT